MEEINYLKIIKLLSPILFSIVGIIISNFILEIIEIEKDIKIILILGFFFIFFLLSLISFIVYYKKRFESLKEFKLDWSSNWDKSNLRKLGLIRYKNLKKFLQTPGIWERFLKKLNRLNKSTIWMNNAFKSIRTGSKGLLDAKYIDHSLISVPPPFDLLNRVIINLNTKSVFGIIAPSGWGKSRLVLWVALVYYLESKNKIFKKKRKIYYFGDPIDLENEENREILIQLLKKKRNLVIIDDFHRYNEIAVPISYWRYITRIAISKKSYILFLQTKSIKIQKHALWVSDFPYLTVDEYLGYWKPIWLKRFTIWFKGLGKTNLKTYLRLELLEEPYKMNSPWSFVSAIVDLRNLIKNQLSIELDRHLIVLFTIFVWGFTISGEKGLNLIEIFNGLLWLKKNKKHKWDEIEKTGGALWSLIKKNNEIHFYQESIKIIEEWRSKPKDSENIRLLPSEGVFPNEKVPVRIHHTAWWEHLIKKLWKNEWKEYYPVKEACELVIIHGSPIIHGKWINLKKNCEILKNCKNILVLNLNETNVNNIEVLSSCSNLKELYLNEIINFEISIINKLSNLQKLSLNWDNHLFKNQNQKNLNKLRQLIEKGIEILPRFRIEASEIFIELEKEFISYKELNFLKDLEVQIGEKIDNSYFNLKKGKIIYLNLKDLGITVLPDSIGHLNQLKILHLENNKLEFLPDSIGHLHQLKILHLEHNKLCIIPESISNLKNLQVLYLHDNNLKELPKSIGNLISLVYLDLDHNQLKYLPKSIANFKKLKSLHLDFNNLIKIPESIVELSSLKYLYLDNNLIKNLQDSIKKKKSLKILTL